MKDSPINLDVEAELAFAKLKKKLTMVAVLVSSNLDESFSKTGANWVSFKLIS